MTPSVGPVAPESLAELAGLLADRTRAAFCLALIDGRAWTAGELARHAGVAPSTASEHLDRLVASGLLATEKQGRHRYLRLADARAAGLIESLAEASGAEPSRPDGLRAVRAAGRLAAARTCYDHFAGTLGVGLHDALVERGMVNTEDGLALTADGRRFLADLTGDPLDGPSRRPLLRSCLDWTERRHHLAGRVGAALCTTMFERSWVTRGRDRRSVVVTATGMRELQDRLGLELPAA
ncbi:ArsR family transcriptional regulator [Pseudonocardia sediminis]|uniref:ArsR family transcriptional regulator n=1 Tax=Pseudonocardia sediminis TaxID=1397368 RepID=A0A4Q7UQ03_PSEST|nr:winged helix-turn-helix domain-containing protein [Pseudonocardia sediminis]RZT83812.1 ArsR family transcriptional regulator [Pseudonocardia sediminis]